ncbi:MAG: YbaN family protein [Planctomycetes bacterium]|nr:YbaN family protein [Planctomycetota bacterium]
MRPLFLALAGFFFVLAVLGVFLPVLPTTPFLLLTSACLVRSSPHLNEKLRRSPLFGPLLRDWEAHRGVRLHVKVTAMTLIVLVVAWSLFFRELSVAMQVLLCSLAALGAFVVLRLETVRDE